MLQWSANINVMIKAVRLAGRSLARDFGEIENLQASQKNIGRFVHRSRKRAFEILVEDLTQSRVNYGMCDASHHYQEGEDPTRYWMVNELVGEKNFASAVPFWGVVIGLEHKKKVVASVIYSPILDDLFLAEKGKGAWLNDHRIRVRSQIKKAHLDLNCDYFASFAAYPQWLRKMAHISPYADRIISLGSSALGMAYVASGRGDGYFLCGGNQTGFEVGAHLLSEAGGTVGSYLDGGGLIHIASGFDNNANLLRIINQDNQDSDE